MPASVAPPPAAPRRATPAARVLLVPLALALATLLAAWLRLPELALRPMHGDEAIHADKLDALWRSGSYRYDPREYHGPTLYFFALPLVLLSGAQNFAEMSEATLRLSTALFGIALIPLLWLVRDGLDAERGSSTSASSTSASSTSASSTSRRSWMVWAGLLGAASPFFAFYARYFIQEILLVFWTMLLIGCAWRFQVEKKTAWLVGAGLGAGLMLATKETSIIALACAGVASLVARWKFSPREAGILAGVAGAMAALLYTSFGRNPRGIVDASGALGVYFQRAQGGEAQGALHQHPPAQYFEWLLWFARAQSGPHWSEWAIAVLSVVGIIVCARRWKGEEGPSWTRFALSYTLAMALVYSLIPYKTPWCALGFWHGATWLSGIGAAALVQGAAWKKLAFGLPILASVAHLSVQARAATVDTRLSLNRNNPWLYSHPTRDVGRLRERLQVLSKASGAGANMLLIVVAPGDDYWPIPFYARDLKQVGYFQAVPPELKAARPSVVIASSVVAEEVAARLGDKYQSSSIGLRPRVQMRMFIEGGLAEKAYR